MHWRNSALKQEAVFSCLCAASKKSKHFSTLNNNKSTSISTLVTETKIATMPTEVSGFTAAGGISMMCRSTIRRQEEDLGTGGFDENDYQNEEAPPSLLGSNNDQNKHAEDSSWVRGMVPEEELAGAHRGPHHDENKDRGIQTTVKNSDSWEISAGLDAIFESAWAELGFSCESEGVHITAAQQSCGDEGQHVHHDERPPHNDHEILMHSINETPPLVHGNSKFGDTNEGLFSASNAVSLEKPIARKGRKTKGKHSKNDLGNQKSKPGPTRPLSAYNLFFRDFRDQIVLKFGRKVPFVTMGREVGKKWNILTKKERSKWEKQAEIDSERYQRELTAFKAKEREEKRLRRSSFLGSTTTTNLGSSTTSSPSEQKSTDGAFVFKSEFILPSSCERGQTNKESSLPSYAREQKSLPSGLQIPPVYPPSGSCVFWPEPRTGRVELQELQWKVYSVPAEKKSSFVQHVKQNMGTARSSSSLSSSTTSIMTGTNTHQANAGYHHQKTTRAEQSEGPPFRTDAPNRPKEEHPPPNEQTLPPAMIYDPYSIPQQYYAYQPTPPSYYQQQLVTQQQQQQQQQQAMIQQPPPQHGATQYQHHPPPQPQIVSPAFPQVFPPGNYHASNQDGHSAAPVAAVPPSENRDQMSQPPAPSTIQHLPQDHQQDFLSPARTKERKAPQPTPAAAPVVVSPPAVVVEKNTQAQQQPQDIQQQPNFALGAAASPCLPPEAHQYQAHEQQGVSFPKFFSATNAIPANALVQQQQPNYQYSYFPYQHPPHNPQQYAPPYIMMPPAPTMIAQVFYIRQPHESPHDPQDKSATLLKARM